MTDFDRPTISKGLLGEYAALEQLLGELTADDLEHETRCAGWQVRDVLGHVVGLATDVTTGQGGNNTPEEQAAARRSSSPDQLRDELRTALTVAEPLLASFDDAAWASPSPVPELTIGDAILTIWYDAWVHRDDVTSALGRPPSRDAGLDASVEYLRRTLDQQGVGYCTDGVDPYDFVMAATGRIAPESVGLPAEVNIYR